MKQFQKKLKNSILLVLVFIFFYNFSYGQSNRKENQIDIYINNFFTNLADNKIDEAVDGIYATNKWLINDESKKVVKDQFNQFKKGVIGKYYGYESLNQVELNQIFIFKSYVLKYDRQPLRLIFGFYKPENTWYLYSLKLDINLDEELEEKIKVR